MQLTDLKLVVRTMRGNLIHEDCSCNLKFMKEAMVRVWEKLRQKFFWVKVNDPIYLVMDNAGGHGDKATVKEYTNLLKEKFKVIVIYQTPRLPYTNVLDLGFWAALQSKVEKVHYGRRGNTKSLVASVYETWRMEEFNFLLMRIFDRLKKVLVLIVEGNGGCDLVEKKRCRHFRNLDLWELPASDDAVEDGKDGKDGKATVTTPTVVAVVHAGDEEDDSDVEDNIVVDNLDDGKTATEEVIINDDDDDEMLCVGMLAM